MQHIGENIKRIISESQFSAREVSEKLDVTYQYLYKIFNNKNIDSKYLIELSDILGVPISVFFGEEYSKSVADIIELNQVKIKELEEQLKESEEKSQTRQTIINLVFQTLKQLNSKYELLVKFAGEMEAMNDGHNPDTEKFLYETMTSLDEMQKSLFEWSKSINQSDSRHVITLRPDPLKPDTVKADYDIIPRVDNDKS